MNYARISWPWNLLGKIMKSLKNMKMRNEFRGQFIQALHFKDES